MVGEFYVYHIPEARYYYSAQKFINTVATCSLAVLLSSFSAIGHNRDNTKHSI